MHTKILKRCGLVLIVVGALDIAFMVWCISNGRSYSSSLNIFALFGGILLVRGSLKTARWVARISSFMLAACGVGLLVTPFLYPVGYWLAVLRSGVGASASTATALVFLALIYWVRQQTMHPEVLEAERAAGLPAPKIKSAVVVGLALPVLLVTPLGFMFRGETAHEAIRRADQQLGGNYRYVVTSMQMNSNMKEKHVSAIVAAYNDTELRSIQVSWKE